MDEFDAERERQARAEPEYVFEILFKNGVWLRIDRVLELVFEKSLPSGKVVGLTCRQHPEAKCRLFVAGTNLKEIVAVVERRP